jgi:predicted Zn-dependent peptidase
LKIATTKVVSELSTVGLWFRSGSIHETRSNNGTAHFLEHILFRGNSIYPKTVLEDLTERTGVNIRAATGKAYTGFWAQTESKQIPIAIDVISQMILNPTFKAHTIESERSTILFEVQEVGQDFLEMLMEKAMTVSFPNSSLGFPILGTPQTIQTINLEMIKTHYETFFNPSNCYFSCATNLEHKEIVETIEKSTRFLKRRPSIEIQSIENGINPKFETNRLSFGSKFLDKSWISLSLPTPPLHTKEFLIWSIVKNAIGDLRADRPFNVSPLLEKSGFDQLTINLDNLARLCVLTILGTCPVKKEEEVIKSILKALIESTVSMTSETLEFAKRQTKMKIAIALSDTRTIAEEVALQLMYWKGWRNLDDWTRTIDELTLRDVRPVVEQFFANDAPLTVLTLSPSS